MGLFNLFKKKEAPKPAAEPAPPVKVIVWDDRKAFVSMDEKQEKQFKKYIRDEVILNENDDYDLPKKELIEDYAGESVYRYYPKNLPRWDLADDGTVTVDGIVMGHIEASKVANIRKSRDEGHEYNLTIFGGKYKEVDDDSIEVVNDPFSLAVCYELKK